MGLVADKRRGAEWGEMLWFELMARGKVGQLDGEWAFDSDAAVAARLEKADREAFTAAAKKRWLTAQRRWRKEDCPKD